MPSSSSDASPHLATGLRQNPAFRFSSQPQSLSGPRALPSTPPSHRSSPNPHRRSRAATKTSDGTPLPHVPARDPTHSCLPLCAGAGCLPGPTSDQLFLKIMDKGPIRSREHSALQPQQNGCAPTFPRTYSAPLYEHRSMLPSTSSADYTTPSPSSLKTSRCFHISSYMQSP
jgi:hypothetical protein